MPAKMISALIHESVHKNAHSKLYAINYQLCAAIQQMGCGSSDAIQLAGFLEMACGDRVKRTLQQVEEVMGPMQERLRVSSEIEAVGLETKLAEEHNDCVLHECIVEGHEHGPKPKLKTSYGKLIF